MARVTEILRDQGYDVQDTMYGYPVISTAPTILAGEWRRFMYPENRWGWSREVLLVYGKGELDCLFGIAATLDSEDTPALREQRFTETVERLKAKEPK